MPKSKTMNAVARGIVGDVDAARARVLVEFPWMGPGALSIWAPVATLMSGGGRGTYFMPEPGDEVLVAFDQGRLRVSIDSVHAPEEASEAFTRMRESRNTGKILIDWSRRS